MLPSIIKPCVYGVLRSICFKLDCFRGGERMSLLRVTFADVALPDCIAPGVRAGVCATIFGPFFQVCWIAGLGVRTTAGQWAGGMFLS